MIAGIDYSTRAVDIVLLDEDTDAATWHRFALQGADAFERARNVSTQLPGRFNSDWEGWGVIAVGIEDPRGYGAGSLYRVQGAILACIPRDLLVHPLIPSSWRKTVGLPGNAPKWEVETFVHGATTTYTAQWPQDACDAFCIALATRTLIQKVAA